MVTQDYETNADRAYVIVGNSALVQCEIPSFVSDFVSVESWVDNNENQYFLRQANNHGKLEMTKNILIF